MARTKEFDRDEALQTAVTVFADAGFEGTSTDVLLKRMGISRQSMYDTFGDKHALYLAALRLYGSSSVSDIIASMQGHSSAREKLEAGLKNFVERPSPQSDCLGVSSICEFGTSDPDISTINGGAADRLTAAFARIVEEGKAAGEFSADIDPQAAAEFLATTLSGLKVAARGGSPRSSLHQIIQMALRSLT